jgi:methylglutaconyl-CoA hydratase
MPYQTLSLELTPDRKATLTLNRPDRRNAINHQLIDDLLAALAEVQSSTALVLILTGAGKSFCSGMDLAVLESLTGQSPEQIRADSERMAQLFRSVYEFPLPTIAAVNGPAIAGGCGLATLCDITIASSEAKFGYTEVRIGFLPAIVSAFLVRQVGEKQARELLLTGKIIGAEEAQRMGLVNTVCAPGQLMPQAHAMAAQLLENSPSSLRATKELLSRFSRASLSSDIKAGIDANYVSRATDDFREGIRTFLEKRKPKWSGE